MTPINIDGPIKEIRRFANIPQPPQLIADLMSQGVTHGDLDLSPGLQFLIIVAMLKCVGEYGLPIAGRELAVSASCPDPQRNC